MSPAAIAGAVFAFIQACSGQSGSGFTPQVGPVATGFALPVALGTAMATALGVVLGAALATTATGALGASLGTEGAGGGGGSAGLDSPSGFEQAVISRRTKGRTWVRIVRASVVQDANVADAMQRSIVELISAKRDGLCLTSEEIAYLISSFMDGSVADYQMSAFLMAAFLRGLDDAETVALTEAMLASGTVIDLSSVPGIKVDKHSTGGVGDKVSICLAPLVAACGVPVPMVSGRGLGHTGGTLDKLEAIPGFRTDLSVADFSRIVGEVGTSLIGQTKEIAPADKRIYALRDVTATVECIPLIVASILSKKLAEGIDGLVLDVKVGRGAFMKDEASARKLAEALVRVGTRAHKKVVAILTNMDSPLGVAVGNAIETREALEVLHGKGPADLVECTLVLGAEMLVLGGKAKDATEGRTLISKAISSGDGVRIMERLVAAQGGDAKVVTEPARMKVAEVTVAVTASSDGFVAGVDALEIGMASVAMGAGRTRADQAVDPEVGISIFAKPGAHVKRGDELAQLHVRNASDAAKVSDRVRNAFRLEPAAPSPVPLVRGRVD